METLRAHSNVPLKIPYEIMISKKKKNQLQNIRFDAMVSVKIFIFVVAYLPKKMRRIFIKMYIDTNTSHNSKK